MLLREKECPEKQRVIAVTTYTYFRAIALFTFLTAWEKIDRSLNLQLFTEGFSPTLGHPVSKSYNQMQRTKKAAASPPRTPQQSLAYLGHVKKCI